jgi:hypothetical protein
MLVLEQQRRVFQKSLLACDRDVKDDVAGRQEFGNTVHPLPILPAKAGASSGSQSRHSALQRSAWKLLSSQNCEWALYAIGLSLEQAPDENIALQ